MNVVARKKESDRNPDGRADAAELGADDPRVDAALEHVGSPEAEIGRVREDEGFMALLRTVVERDQDILDRLAE